MTFRVLIATRSFGSTSNMPWMILEEAGVEIVKADMSVEMTEDHLIELLQGIDGAVIGVVPLTARVMENTPQLKIVSMHGVGVDHVDLKAASRQGIIISNCPGANDQAVADLAIGLMLSIARQIPLADKDLRSKKWGRYTGVELWMKTLGLIGFGRVGRDVARRAIGFEMPVIVYDPYVHQEQVNLPGVTLTSLDDVLTKSDFISLHTALTEETRHMIGEAQLRSMKLSTFLINTARGGLIDEPALCRALSEKWIAGAAIDVYVDEPPWGSPLLEAPNLITTPHIGAHTGEAIERMGTIAAKNVVKALFEGEPLCRVI